MFNESVLRAAAGASIPAATGRSDVEAASWDTATGDFARATTAPILWDLTFTATTGTDVVVSILSAVAVVTSPYVNFECNLKNGQCSNVLISGYTLSLAFEPILTCLRAVHPVNVNYSEFCVKTYDSLTWVDAASNISNLTTIAAHDYRFRSSVVGTSSRAMGNINKGLSYAGLFGITKNVTRRVVSYHVFNTSQEAKVDNDANRLGSALGRTIQIGAKQHFSINLIPCFMRDQRLVTSNVIELEGLRSTAVRLVNATA